MRSQYVECGEWITLPTHIYISVAVCKSFVKPKHFDAKFEKRTLYKIMSRKIAKWISERIDPHCHAVKTEDGVRYQNTNTQILEAVNNRSRWLTKISQKRIKEHFKGESTRYFNGAWRKDQPESLVGFDIDCHGGGTLQGAIECAEFLKTVFLDLYFEVSTNGNGVHCYFVVKRMGEGSKAIKTLLKQLDSWAKEFVHQFDITDIEVKGTLPIYVWEYGKLISVTKGQALKLPRIKNNEQARALMNTTTVDTRFLIKLVSGAPADKSHLPRILGGKTDFQIENQKSDLQPKIKKRKCGSTTADIGEVLSDYLPKLKTQYMKAAYHLTELPIRCLSGREVGTVEDLAILLMLWTFFEEKPNEDQTLPVNRFKKSWQKLYENGHISRQWNDHRFAVLRNHLSELGLIDWIDSEFEFFEGRVGEGTACKWKMNQLMVEIIEDCGEIVEESSLEVDFENERREERENFIETHSQSTSSIIINLAQERLSNNLKLLERGEIIVPRRKVWTTERVEELISAMD